MLLDCYLQEACLRSLIAGIVLVDRISVERGHRADFWILEEVDVFQSRKHQFLLERMIAAAHHKRTVFSKIGYVGLASSAVRKGDALYAFYGGLLYVLREKTGSEKESEFIGGCYAHGILDGALLHAFGNG